MRVFHLVVAGLAVGVLSFTAGCCKSCPDRQACAVVEIPQNSIVVNRNALFQDPDREVAAVPAQPFLEVENAQFTTIATPGFESGTAPDSAEPAYAAVVSVSEPQPAAQDSKIPELKLMQEKWNQLPESARSDILFILNSAK